MWRLDMSWPHEVTTIHPTACSTFTKNYPFQQLKKRMHVGMADSRSRGRGSNAQICTLLQATGTPGIRVRLYSSILEIKNLGKLPESWVPDMRCSKIEENYHKIGQLSFFPPCFPRCEPRLQTRTQSCHLLARFRWPSSHGWSLGLRVKLRRNPNCQLLNRFHGKMGMPPLMLILVSIPPCNWR